MQRADPDIARKRAVRDADFPLRAQRQLRDAAANESVGADLREIRRAAAEGFETAQALKGIRRHPLGILCDSNGDRHAGGIIKQRMLAVADLRESIAVIGLRQDKVRRCLKAAGIAGDDIAPEAEIHDRTDSACHRAHTAVFGSGEEPGFIVLPLEAVISLRAGNVGALIVDARLDPRVACQGAADPVRIGIRFPVMGHSGRIFELLLLAVKDGAGYDRVLGPQYFMAALAVNLGFSRAVPPGPHGLLQEVMLDFHEDRAVPAVGGSAVVGEEVGIGGICLRVAHRRDNVRRCVKADVRVVGKAAVYGDLHPACESDVRWRIALLLRVRVCHNIVVGDFGAAGHFKR